MFCLAFPGSLSQNAGQSDSKGGTVPYLRGLIPNRDIKCNNPYDNNLGE